MSQQQHPQDPPHSAEDDNRHFRSRARRRRRMIHALHALAILLMASLLVCAAYIAHLVTRTPSTEDLLAARRAQPSILLSSNGTHLATYSRGQQEAVTLDRVSPHVIDALIATEDHRFHQHRGIDIGRTLAAVVHTLSGNAQGGSTITQQLARNMFPKEIGRARSIERKLREIITAVKIETTYTKEQILETYLNTVPFLYNVIGIEMAARTYYDKSASELDVLQSATLIGMLKGTSYYNPVLNPERAYNRRNTVLAQMVKHGMLSADDYAALHRQPLQALLNRQPDPLGVAPHFAAHVRRQLIEWADRNDYNLYTDGLIIHSTIDDRLQKAAAEAVERQSEILQAIADVEWGRNTERVASRSPGAYKVLRKQVEPFHHFWNARGDLLDTFIRETPEYRKAVNGGLPDHAALAKLKADSKFIARLRASKTRLEAGFVALDPATGEVKAWVGSRNYARDQFDHVAQAERQPGSTFKPIVYGAALEHGLGPDRIYPDGQVEIPLDNGRIWRPTDMSGFSGRMMRMREGLVYSKNSITVQVMQDVGLPHVIRLARAAGIHQSRLYPVPSLSLGTSPVTLLEMASAYSTIAQAGMHHKPAFIRKITDRDGKVLAEFHPEAQRAMSEETATALIDMLRDVVRYGTGAQVRNRFHIAADIAGKTGTTQNNTDGWFILMHPHLVAGAWVGFNDSRVTMRSDYWGQGGNNAVLLAGDFFQSALKARLIDVKARFPAPKQPPLTTKTPADQGEEYLDAVPSGYGVVSRRDSGITMVVGPDGVQSIEHDNDDPLGDDELGRFLSRLEREEAVRGRVESSGDGSVGSSQSGEGGDVISPGTRQSSP